MAKKLNSNFIPNEAKRAVEIILDNLADSLVGVYLYGSSIDSGLQKNSDIDLLVLTNRPLTTDLRKEFATSFLNVSGPIGNKESIRPLEITVVNIKDIFPWTYPPKRELQYGEWLRSEVKEGMILKAEQDPDLAILLKQVRQNSISLIGPYAIEVLPPIPDSDFRRAILDSLPLLVQNIEGDERNTILTLARMYYSLINGTITSKHKASAWLIKELPEEFHSVVNNARLAYLDKNTDSLNFKENELERFTEVMSSKIKDAGS